MADQERACTLGEETSMSRRVKFGAPVARMAAALVVLGVTAAAQGVQLMRVHDAAGTRQAMEVWRASVLGREK